MMLRILMTIMGFWPSIRSEWNESVITGLDLKEMGKKEITLLDCKGRLDVKGHHLRPRPTCDFITKATHRTTPLAVTFYQSIAALVPVTVRACRKMRITTTYYSNFLGFEKITERKREWEVADLEVCKQLLVGAKPERESLISGADQYGKTTDHYKWFSKNTVEVEVYYLSRYDVLLNELEGRLVTTRHEDLNCDYYKEHCTMGKGGVLWWVLDRELTQKMKCNYEKAHEEICAGMKIKDQDKPYLAITCSQSKTRMYIPDAGRVTMTPGKDCGVTLFNTVSGNILSLNATASDVAEIQRASTNEETIDLYSLKRVRCTHQSGVELCTLDAHYSQDCGGVDCDKLSTMTTSYCTMGVCRIPEGLACAHFPTPSSKSQSFIDELAPYVAGKPNTVNDSTVEEYCMEIYRDGVSYYPTGLVVADKATQNKPFYSLVVEAGQLLPGHTIEGYTVEMGRLCDPEGSEQVVAKGIKTYAAAASYVIKMKPNTYHDYVMCMAEGDTVTFVKFEKKGGKSDFILRYSGLPTTKSIKGSFIESQLNYIGTMVEQERANTLKKKLHKDCLEEMKDWASGQALLDLNPDLYVQAYVDDQRAGRLEKGKLISWQCTKTNEWQILENINSTNCTRNTKVAFRHTMDDSVHEGYVERQTGRIVDNPGTETPCSEKDHVLAIGNGMLLKYDAYGKTTVYAEQVVIRTPTSFMEAKPAYTDYDGAVSLMERVIDLEEDKLIDTDKGFIYKGMDKFVNTTTGLVSIFKARKFSLRGMIHAEETLGSMIVLIILILVVLLSFSPLGKLLAKLIAKGLEGSCTLVRNIFNCTTPEPPVIRRLPTPRPPASGRKVFFTNVPEDDVHID